MKKVNEGAVIKEPGSSKKNKTGSWRTFRPVRDKKKCTKCGLCWIFCPDNAIDKNFNINYDYCKGCLICVRECPFNALTVKKEEK